MMLQDDPQLRTGEVAYPIYHVRVEWSEATPPGSESRITRVGKPPQPHGRTWNGTAWDLMERIERPTEAIVAELLAGWGPESAAKKLREPADLTVTVKLIDHDVWCSGWFSHWTFDVGMLDEDVIASFERYVERILYADNLSEQEKGGRLMGAEDQWRWHGCQDGDPRASRTPAPCRCHCCKERGVVRIDH